MRWIGTESGIAPNETWSTINPSNPNGGGVENGSVFAPAEADTTLQLDDQWFYNPQVGLRSVDELKVVYESTVGRNSKLLLNIAPSASGKIPDAAMARYKSFGDLVRGCYSEKSAIASTSGIANNSLILNLPAGGAIVDRVTIAEDQSGGQLITSFQVWGVPTAHPGTYQPISQGQSVGNKRIARVFSQFRHISFTQLKLIVAAKEGIADPPRLRQFSAFSACNQRVRDE